MKKLAILLFLLLALGASFSLKDKFYQKSKPIPQKQEKQTLAPSKIVVAYSFVKANQMPVIVAKEKGLFKKYNLDVEIKQVPKNITSVMVAGKADIMLGTPNVALAAVVEGTKLSWVGTVNNDSTIVMLSNKEPNDIKIVGVISGPNKIQSIGLLNLININTNNLIFQEISDNQAKLVAFKEKQVDSIYVQKPDWLIFKKKASLSDDYKIILDSSNNKKAQTPIGIIVRNELLKNNKKAVVNFSKALIEADYWILKNKDGFIKLAEKHFSDMPKEDAKIQTEVYYDTLIGLEFIPTLAKGEEMLNFVSSSNPKAKDYNLTQFVSREISDSLKKEGFLDKFKFN